MAETTTDGLHVPIKTTFDGSGTTAANAAFDKTKGHVKETESAAKDLGLTAENLKAQLTGLLAAGAVWQQFKEGFEQVAALEQAMNQLERATKRNGESFDVVRGKIVGMAESLKKAAGVDDDAAIKGMVALYNATGDVANATDLARLAADVSVGSGKTYEESMQLVTSAAQGKTRALVALKLATDEDTASTLTAQQALDRIQSSFGGAAQNAKGLKVELDRLKEGWEDVRNETVERVTPSLEVVIKLVLSFFTALDGAWRMVADALVGVYGMLGKFGSYMKALVTGDVEGMKAAVVGMGKEAKGATDSIVEGARTAAKKIEDIWAGARAAIELGNTTPKAIGGSGGDKSGGGDIGKGQYGPALKEFEDYERKMFEFEQGLIKERAKAWEKYEAAKLALKKYGAKEDSRLEKELDKERERFMDAQTQRIKDQAMLEREVAKEKAQMGLRLASATVGLGRALFGESKELALAEAMINTAAAITEASPNVWLMAFAAVSGAAQIAKIQSVQPSGSGDVTVGKGFDNAQYDAAAVAGGRRWAMDMVGKFGSGASAGWSEGMRGAGRGNTYDNRSTNNYNISVQGFLNPSDQHSMAQFARRLAVVNKTVEGQRRTARTSR